MARKGMIHTCDYNWAEVEQGAFAVFDLSEQLTTTLQQMVRQGQIFKCVGIDIAVLPNSTGVDYVEAGVAGVISYLSPTKGRCDAWRRAFFATQKWRKIQGVSPNYQYDFRLGFDAGPEIAGKLDFGEPIVNQAWLEYYADDSSEGSTQGLYLLNSYASESQQSIFDVWNLGIDYKDGLDTPTFGQGWTPYSPYESTDDKIEMDFVKNEKTLLVTNPKGPAYAQLNTNDIAFSVSFTQDDDKGTSTLPYQFRPVSNEYIPIMCGLVGMQVSDTVQESDNQTLKITFYISGWKPILQRRRK